MNTNKPEPPPKKNDEKAVWDLVLEDMQNRDKEGLRKYETRLQSFNGRNSLIDAYQEQLDLVVYMRQAVEEREKMIDVLKYYANLMHWFDDEHNRFFVSDGYTKAVTLLKKLGEL